MSTPSIQNYEMAFPGISLVDHPDDPERVGQRFNLGMSLRDYFAGQAIIGIFSSGILDKVPKVGGEEREQTLARWSYEMADAMLDERAKST